jgi:hypothetical protein
MLRGLSFPFPLSVGIMSFLATLTIGPDSHLFSLVIAEEKLLEQQLLRFFSSSLVDGADLYHTAFI